MLLNDERKSQLTASNTSKSISKHVSLNVNWSLLGREVRQVSFLLSRALCQSSPKSEGPLKLVFSGSDLDERTLEGGEACHDVIIEHLVLGSMYSKVFEYCLSSGYLKKICNWSLRRTSPRPRANCSKASEREALQAQQSYHIAWICQPRV